MQEACLGLAEIMTATGDRGVQSSTWRIIEYLQTHETATLKELEAYLGLTRTAVREHIATLEGGGYVDHRLVHAGRGRPHHEYFNKAKARELFACHCSDLAVTMLKEMMHVVDPATMEQLMARVAHRVAADYAAEMMAALPRERVHELAALMQKKGILCRVHDDGSGMHVTLEMFNCPYHDLALEDRQICDMDRLMIGQAVGVPVELVDCIMDEASSCNFGFRAAPQDV